MKNYFIDKNKQYALYNTVFLPLLKQVYSFVDYVEYYYPKGTTYYYKEDSTGPSKDGATFISNLSELSYRDSVVLQSSYEFNKDKTISMGSTVYNWDRPDTQGPDCSTNPSKSNFNSYLTIMAAPLSIIGIKVIDQDTANYTILEYSGVKDEIYYLICYSLNRNFAYSNLDKIKGTAELTFYHRIIPIEETAEDNPAKVSTAISSDSNFVITPYYQTSSGFVKLNIDDEISINLYNETEQKPTAAKIISEAIKDENLEITFAAL